MNQCLVKRQGIAKLKRREQKTVYSIKKLSFNIQHIEHIYSLYCLSELNL